MAKKNRKSRKSKKWKQLNNNIMSTIVKFIVFITIVEGYYLANYLLSQKFLNEVKSLAQELKLLISRQPTHSFLLLIQQEIIYKNGKSKIEGKDIIDYAKTYQKELYSQEEQLLDKFSNNYDYHN